MLLKVHFIPKVCFVILIYKSSPPKSTYSLSKMTSNLYDEALALINSMQTEEASHRRPLQDQKESPPGKQEISPPSPIVSLQEMCIVMAKIAEDQEEFMNALCRLYTQMIKENDSSDQIMDPKKQSHPTCSALDLGRAKLFDGDRAKFGTVYYLKRMSFYSEASPSCLITSLIYLERAQDLCPALRLTSRTLQRLLLVAVMTATKYLEDACCLNSRWAEIGGLSLQELNALEREFLSCLQFRLGVHPDEYARCTARLASFAPRQGPEGTGRASRRDAAGGTSPLQVTRRGSGTVTAKRAEWDEAGSAAGRALAASMAPHGPADG